MAVGAQTDAAEASSTLSQKKSRLQPDKLPLAQIWGEGQCKLELPLSKRFDAPVTRILDSRLVNLGWSAFEKDDCSLYAAFREGRARASISVDLENELLADDPYGDAASRGEHCFLVISSVPVAICS
jgi:hypothetical protein